LPPKGDELCYVPVGADTKTGFWRKRWPETILPFISVVLEGIDPATSGVQE